MHATVIMWYQLTAVSHLCKVVILPAQENEFPQNVKIVFYYPRGKRMPRVYKSLSVCMLPKWM